MGRLCHKICIDGWSSVLLPQSLKWRTTFGWWLYCFPHFKQTKARPSFLYCSLIFLGDFPLQMILCLASCVLWVFTTTPLAFIFLFTVWDIRWNERIYHLRKWADYICVNERTHIKCIGKSRCSHSIKNRKRKWADRKPSVRCFEFPHKFSTILVEAIEQMLAIFLNSSLYIVLESKFERWDWQKKRKGFLEIMSIYQNLSRHA